MASENVTQINIYPVKSMGRISVSQSWVEKQGLAFDRRFMLAFADGQMVTARKFPYMVKINSVIVADGLIFSLPGQPLLHLRYQDFKMQALTSTVWKDTFTAYTTTDEANDWFSDAIGQRVELLFTGEQSNRYRETLGHAVSFADGYPLLVISEASLAELNRRSPEMHSMDQFRTNLVVSGCEPFVEDSWKTIRIGDVVFESVKPCERCLLTTVDVESGELRPSKEPLRTLSQFRANQFGGVCFGQNLVAKNEGIIRVDDPIEVLEYKEKEQYPDHQSQSQILTCVAREVIAKDFVTFWLTPREGVVLDYLPGQHLPIELMINGENHSRRYTLSSSPSRPGQLAISVKRVNAGRVSHWLIDHFHVGDVLKAQAPEGQFHLQVPVKADLTTSRNASTMQPLLLLSAGSGVTPMLSMLRYLSDQDQMSDVVFYHQCRSVEDIPCREELETLSHQFPGLKVILALTQPPADWFGLRGRFSLSHLKQIQHLEQRQAFVCGPGGFMEKARALMLKAGLPEMAYHQEAFCLSKPVSKPHQTLMLTINGQTIEGNNQQTLLEQAENQGIAISNSCRAGLCGACLVKIEQGQVAQENAPALDVDGISRGMALACCCIPETDIEVKA